LGIAIKMAVLALFGGFLFSAVALAEDKPYVIGPEDVLSVTIFAGGKTQEAIELSVSPKGMINFPFLGKVKASGLTVAQLVDAVTKPLTRDYFVNPQVNIRVKEYKSQKVYITGAVNNPGLYPLDAGLTLLELIAKAGGVTQERGQFAYLLKGSLEKVKDNEAIDQLVEKNRSIKVDLRALMDQGRADQNIALEAGDVVYIQPSAFSVASQSKVYVLGRVKSPGAFTYQEGLTALDACVLAGGFDKYSAPNRTVITRRGSDGSVETIKVDLNKVKEGKEPDVLIKPGDRIYVPKSWF